MFLAKRTLPYLKSVKQVKSLPVTTCLSKFSTSEKEKKYAKSSVYTRTGDNGTSVLFNMSRVSKEADYFEVLGAVDEVSSLLGMAREHCQSSTNNLDAYLEKIQCCLLGKYVSSNSCHSLFHLTLLLQLPTISL